jgi:hypothetical protein
MGYSTDLGTVGLVEELQLVLCLPRNRAVELQLAADVVNMLTRLVLHKFGEYLYRVFTNYSGCLPIIQGVYKGLQGIL